MHVQGCFSHSFNFTHRTAVLVKDEKCIKVIGRIHFSIFNTLTNVGWISLLLPPYSASQGNKKKKKDGSVDRFRTKKKRYPSIPFLKSAKVCNNIHVCVVSCHLPASYQQTIKSFPPSSPLPLPHRAWLSAIALGDFSEGLIAGATWVFSLSTGKEKWNAPDKI